MFEKKFQEKAPPYDKRLTNVPPVRRQNLRNLTVIISTPLLLTSPYLLPGSCMSQHPLSVSAVPSSVRHLPTWPVVHFRYSERTGAGGGSGGGGANLPFSLEGLCAHHGQTLAAQLAAGQSPRLQGQGAGYLPSSYPAPVPDSGPSGVEEFVRSQITPTSSITPLERRPPSRPHLLEVSAAQQRQQDTLREGRGATASAAGTTGGSADGKASHTGETASSSSSSVGGSQGADEDSARGDRGKPHLRTRVPSATAVSYKSPGESVLLTQPISLLGQGASDTSHHSGQGSSDKGHTSASRRNWERSNDGRKSRKGMREGEDEDMDSGPTPRAMMDLGGGEGRSHRAPRVKSAHTSQDMVDAMDSIRQLQHSLATPARPSTSLTSATGTYIKQLIKETNDEIQDLTNEIEDKIEHKLQEVRQLQHHQGAVSARPDFVGGGSQKPVAGSVIDFHQPSRTHSESGDPLLPVYRDSSGGGPEDDPMDLASLQDVDMAEERGPDRGPAAHTTYIPLEERKRVGSAVHSTMGREEYVHITSTDGMGEMVPRARSARSSRQVVETVPTKISLMICSDHKEGGDGSGKQQFLPLYRSVRAPFFRNYSQTRRK